MRLGGSSSAYDVLHVDLEYPERFAPDTYFIKQLRYVLDLYPDTKMYVHIFTDDPSPHLIAQKYERILNNPRLTFGYRTSENRHDSNVLDDFFSMAEFDVLIRPSSGFSEMAGRLGRPSLEIRPLADHYRWEGRRLIITEVGVRERDKTRLWTSRERYIKTEE